MVSFRAFPEFQGLETRRERPLGLNTRPASAPARAAAMPASLAACAFRVMDPCSHLVAYCSPAKTLTFSGLKDNP